MNFRFYFAALLAGAAFCLLLLGGCEGELEDEGDPTIRVGLIASLSGPGRSWGEATLHAAQVIADYHNELGGFEVDGRSYRIELLVEDDGLDPARAQRIAERFVIEEDLRYLIGPLGDDSVVAAAQILDAYGAVYVHYGFDPSLLNEESLGLLGMPLPSQSIPVIADYLQHELGIGSLMVIGRDGEESIHQKRLSERMLDERGLIVHRFAAFDVREETFDLAAEPVEAARQMDRIRAIDPDGILFTGLSPGEFTAVAGRLRLGGYEGVLAAQNSQDPILLAGLEQGSGPRIVYVGGGFPDAERSEYYLDLRNRFERLSGSVGAEFDTKLYALETLLLLIREGGAESLRETDHLREVMAVAEFDDPFFATPRALRLTGERRFGARRQISIPIVVSQFQDGEAEVVYYSKEQD